jgi:hypothetical protein
VPALWQVLREEDSIDQFVSAVDPELLEDRLQVILHCVLGDAELPGDTCGGGAADTAANRSLQPGLELHLSVSNGQGALVFRLGPRLYRPGSARVIIGRTHRTASEENLHVDLVQPQKLRGGCA